MTRVVWYVAFGSAVGGVVRLLLSGYIQQRVGEAFPLGTMVINITGSFLLGFLIRFALGTPDISPEIRAMLTTGFCGGYTTFSTYSYETATLIEDGRYERASLYILLSVAIALLGVFVGFAAARQVLSLRSGN